MRSYKKLINENMRRMLLKEYVMENTKRAGFGSVNIQRTVTCTRIVLQVERPGLVIGRKGSAIKRMSTVIESEFGQENPVIEVEEVKDPALNPNIMAEKLAQALERGWHFRRAGHATVRSIMTAGARGCQVVISGKLTGERHRTEKFTKGTIKYCGDTAFRLMKIGHTTAKLKPGVLGITVKIMPPDAKLPDDITIKEETPQVAEAAAVPAVEVAKEGEVLSDEEKKVLELAKKAAKTKGIKDEVLDEEAVVDILKVKTPEAEEEPAEEKGEEEKKEPKGEAKEKRHHKKEEPKPEAVPEKKEGAE
jgi:small subunit ribosomal protein S3